MTNPSDDCHRGLSLEPESGEALELGYSSPRPQISIRERLRDAAERRGTLEIRDVEALLTEDGQVNVGDQQVNARSVDLGGQ